MKYPRVSVPSIARPRRVLMGMSVGGTDPDAEETPPFVPSEPEPQTVLSDEDGFVIVGEDGNTAIMAGD